MTQDTPTTDRPPQSPAARASAIPPAGFFERDWRRVALVVTVVTALFCGGVIVGLVTTYTRQTRDRLLDQEHLNAMRARLARDPANEDLAATIRREDLQLRQQYFDDRALLDRGAYLLLAAAIALVLSARWYGSLNPRGPRAAEADVTRRRARAVVTRRSLAGVGGISALLAALLIGLAVWPHDPLAPENWQAVLAGPPPEAPVYVDTWPRFRGPSGLGVAPAGDWPDTWDAVRRKNRLWKCPIPGSGKSSPVVWGDRVFLTSADLSRRTLMVTCVNRTTGTVMWTTNLKPGYDSWTEDEKFDFGLEDEDLEGSWAETSWAAPTPATDGQRVYVTFATADVAALDFHGRKLWQHNFGYPNSAYGLASSLLVHKGLLIWQFDQGDDPDGDTSALLALDGKTGDEVWRADGESRPVVNSWSTPVIAEVDGGLELITVSNPWVIAYDPETGIELWRSQKDKDADVGGDVASSPVVVDGVVYLANEGEVAAAIRAGGIDDVTRENILWSTSEDVPLPGTASPVCDGKRLLLAAGSTVGCLDATTGKSLWEHEFDTDFTASPTLVGSLVYLPDTDGKTHIFELGDAFVLKGSGTVGEAVEATPAFADSRIYIRGEKHLFCIGKKTPRAAPTTQGTGD